MKAEKPAEGILKRNDWGNSKWYQVVCGCGQEYHDHNVEVEADETGVNVNIHLTLKSFSQLLSSVGTLRETLRH